MWTLGEDIWVKVLSQHFPLQIFLPIWEDENCGPGRENFLPGFPSSPFSLLCQTVKNTVFPPIFLPLFSILSIFTPTKHSVKQWPLVMTAVYEVSVLLALLQYSAPKVNYVDIVSPALMKLKAMALSYDSCNEVSVLLALLQYSAPKANYVDTVSPALLEA